MLKRMMREARDWSPRPLMPPERTSCRP